MSDSRRHWDAVYQDKAAERVSWYRPRLEISLELIRHAGVSPDDALVDVGGGASTLVDDLLALGYRRVTVADLSGEAIRLAQSRLGPAAARVNWLEIDVTGGIPGGPFRLWHDRAVFHFLLGAREREAYLRVLRQSLAATGQVIIATFGADGPERCSGLPVARYTAETMAQTLGPGFDLLESRPESHRTPSGETQHFVYCRFELGKR